jgi:simple sugar transport system substrate-binding protein
MSEHDIWGEAIERLEWDERKEEETPVKRWRQVTRRTALTGGAAGIAALALEACGNSSSASGSGAFGIFGTKKRYHFVLVNHVTSDIFFTPTRNGAADACKLLGCSYAWTGSSTSNAGEMVDAINNAVAGKADGIGTSLISPTAFTKPVRSALAAGIPVIAYNADDPSTGRLAYIGQDLYLSGQEMGKRIASLVPSGEIGLFIAVPGAANIQPRIDGVINTLKSHPSITYKLVATGAVVPDELTVITSWATGHKTAKGMFAVDAGSTQGVAQTIEKLGLRAKGWKGGGYDLTPTTESLLAKGIIDFTIDQQPYLQGFLPILELYLYNASDHLTGIADVNTGIKFVNKTTIGPYYSTKSRYEGTSSSPGVTKS